MFEKVWKVKEVLLVLALSGCFVLASALPCFADTNNGVNEEPYGIQIGSFQVPNDMQEVVNDGYRVVAKVQASGDYAYFATSDITDNCVDVSMTYDQGFYKFDNCAFIFMDNGTPVWSPSTNFRFNVRNYESVIFTDSENYCFKEPNDEIYGGYVNGQWYASKNDFEQALNSSSGSGTTVSDLLGTSTGVMVDNAEVALAAILPAALGIIAVLIGLYVGIRIFRRSAR